ncbi:hypothetical protein MUN82_12645 [Hymenobacter aerilatus]|uniref:Copper-binding protein MbnP-like domain-containing protein n=1 Tax=Hymenobacter aerilatus TaxID=2932251 RepID=A0A8T9SPR9_9BACT|nr:MbnP family protein [Hymenobacter aerilatus]UOR03795.1 hypothetical protein MUN82_12645 [Hymenobacter aerilatus]
MKFSLPTFWVAAVVTVFSLASCNDKEKEAQPTVGTLDIEMEHVVGNRALALNTTTYTNPVSNEQFTVSRFNYYVSNIRLQKADGTEYPQPESYYLVQESDTESKHLHLKDVPIGDYTGISFVVGVDSARNVAGAQTGALDVNNNMFWDWNSGYIFFKMEGNLVASSAYPAKSFLMHVGGFTKPYNAVRTVKLTFPSSNLLVGADHSPELHLRIDALKVLNGPQPIQLSTFRGAHMPGANAVQVANNYAAGMFLVDHINAN